MAKDIRTYHEQAFIDNTLRLREVLQTMPPFVKDYFLHPKKKGYQSLHVIFKDTYGNYFEYQVRTYSMDVWAEYQDASHESFKLQQIKDIPEIKLEREKVNLSFYRTINNEVIADKSGFERSIQILFLKDLVEKHI